MVRARPISRQRRKARTVDDALGRLWHFAEVIPAVHLSLRSYSLVALVGMAAALLACGSDSATSSAGQGGNGGAGTGAAAGSGGQGGGGAGSGVCTALCGATYTHDAAIGQASETPVGCAGGDFVLSWSLQLPAGIDAAKAVPILADVDADGALDLLLNARKLDTPLLFHGEEGAFVETPIMLGSLGFSGGWGIDVGDFASGDGLDVLAGDHNHGALGWRNNGGLSFMLATGGLPAGTFSGVGLADLDGDGNLDAVFGADQFGTGFALARGLGDGTWQTVAANGLPAYVDGQYDISNAGSITFADVNADGQRDIVAFAQSTGSIEAFVYQNMGAFNFMPLGSFGGGGNEAVGNPIQGSVGDIDCNGQPDIAAGGRLFLADGSGWVDGASVNGAKLSHLADMNGDGKLDLVTHQATAGLQLHLQGEDGSFNPSPSGLPDGSYLPPGFDDVTAVTEAFGFDVGDVDGDGRLDIVRLIRTDGMVGGVGQDGNRHFLELWTRTP